MSNKEIQYPPNLPLLKALYTDLHTKRKQFIAKKHGSYQLALDIQNIKRQINVLIQENRDNFRVIDGKATYLQDT